MNFFASSLDSPAALAPPSPTTFHRLNLAQFSGLLRPIAIAMAATQISNDELVLVSTPVGGVRVLTLNRPAKRNALSGALISEFLDKLSAAARDPAIGAVVITGSETCFSGKLSFPMPAQAPTADFETRRSS